MSKKVRSNRGTLKKGEFKETEVSYKGTVGEARNTGKGQRHRAEQYK
jgi:hypothetical protein